MILEVEAFIQSRATTNNNTLVKIKRERLTKLSRIANRDLPSIMNV